MILFTYQGLEVVNLPASPAPSSLSISITDFAPASNNPFSGSQQVTDWGSSLVSFEVQLPPMKRDQADDWSAWMMQCRGMTRAFLIGDPIGATPKGSVLNTGASPLVDGGNQKGYSLNVKGFVPNATGVLKRGDWVQLGYRLHKCLDNVDADANGKATLPLYPNLRESPADGQEIVTRNTVGLFRMASNTNKYSINEGQIFGFQFTIREAF